MLEREREIVQGLHEKHRWEIRLVRIVHLQTDNFPLFLHQQKTTYFRLHDEQTVNGLRASVFRFPDAQTHKWNLFSPVSVVLLHGIYYLFKYVSS